MPAPTNPTFSLRNRPPRHTPPPNPATQPLTDLAAFPILTEEVGFPPSPLARSGSGSGAPSSTGLSQIAANAIADVLGWKAKPNDPKAFLGALTQSFSLREVEGHVESKWMQRSYAVQTDLAGGLSGAQASLFTRAKYALDQSLPLLDGLTPLDPDVDLAEAEAARQVVRSQMTELVNEFAFSSGPRVSRVNQYFLMLLFGPPAPPVPSPPASPFTVVTDPDQIGGNLGNLRNIFGLATQVYPNAITNPATGAITYVGPPTASNLINTLDDEQNAKDYRVLSDYLTSLAQSWISNYQFFLYGTLGTAQPFFGTQLVLISRQLQVVAEMVDEVRFTMDSVFLGPAERQTIMLNIGGSVAPIFLEDLLLWIQNLATVEGPTMIQTSGKFGVAQVVQIAANQVNLVSLMPGQAGLPPAFYTPRVQIAVNNLQVQLNQLLAVTTPAQLAPLPQNPQSIV
jgi:hypothetical protein